MKNRYFAFVSYASPDRAAAEDLVKALEAQGLSCWVAPRNIEASADYGEQILQGIRDSTALVLVFSQHSNASKFCQREVERGVHYGRRIFPVRIDNSLPSGPMEFHLSVVQWIDAQGGKDWAGIASQLFKSSERLSSQAPSESSMPTGRGSKPYRFEERDCRTVEELAAALAQNWENGVKNFGRGFVADWVKTDLRNFDLASRLMDLHEDPAWSPDEKLTLALGEMDPELPGMWRGNVVNREWAAREPERFKEMLTSKARSKLEQKVGWPGELVVKLEQLRTQRLRPEEQAALEQVVFTGQPELKLGAWEVDSETLGQKPEEAVALLEGRVPQIYEELTQRTWLAETAARWREYWSRVEVLDCGTAKDKALPWIIGPTEQLTARATELLGQYVGSRRPAVQALWDRGDWGTAECVALCATEEAQLLTETEQTLQQDLAWVKKRLRGQVGATRMQQVETWLRQNDWEALTEPLVEVRLPENWTLLEQQSAWSELVEQAEWSYREAVALCAWVRSAPFLAAKHGHQRLAWTGAAMRRAGFAEDQITRTLTQGGTVVAWGDNYHGQTTVPIDLSGVVAIAAGYAHTVALKSNGTVVAWGGGKTNTGKDWDKDVEFGQSIIPTGLSGIAAIAAGYHHTVALKGDGTLVAWGLNDEGQTTVPTDLNGIVAIAAGGSHTVALKSDGTVVAWGLNDDDQTTVPTNLNEVVAIAAGYWHTVALKSNGTVVAWGNDANDQTTVPSGLSKVVAIAAGGLLTVALKSDGTLVAWGEQATVPRGLSGVTAIAADAVYTVALKSDGTLAAWGFNGMGEKPTVPAGLSGVTAIAAGGDHTVALKLD